jgi:hypothetical protein
MALQNALPYFNPVPAPVVVTPPVHAVREQEFDAPARRLAMTTFEAMITHQDIRSFAEDRVNLPAPDARRHRDQVNRLRD